MNARDEALHAMSFGPCSPNAANELLDRVEREAKTASDLDQRRELRRLELLEGNLIDYINRADTPAMVSHILTGLLALAGAQASEEIPDR